ncbi:hypothetical protein QP097_04680 [Oligella urethralis]|nr:hypothetical protein [Oligella urethralis]MDK6202764.1 hypothetical protein [Oligella urethralis]
MSIKDKIRSFLDGLDEFYHAPYRQTLSRAYRDEQDLFMLIETFA